MSRARQFPGAGGRSPRAALTILRRYPAASVAALALLGACSSVLAASRVSVQLEGDIAPECSVGGSAGGAGATLGLQLKLDDITRPGRKDYPFLLNCNAPFNYRVEAQYGAFTNTGLATAPDGLAAAVPYDVTVRIPTDGAPIVDTCPSASLRAGRVSCPFSNSGNSIALLSEAQISLVWRSPANLLAAGEYVDRISIIVAVNI